MAEQPKKGFQTPPEVLDYFEGRDLKPGFSWLDVWAQEHAYGFTVAKAVDTELLTIFKTSLQQALKDGETFETWVERVSKDLGKAGWWKPRVVADPTGKLPEQVVDFSSPRRLRTIFQSNMRAARAAGQWERMQRTKRGMPNILYVRTAASDPRPEHLQWVGIILPIDDPFWRTHFPPNGWLCKCSVRQITNRERDRLLEDPKSYTEDPPDLGPPRVFKNKRTGELSEIPPGIDPGWHTNPGLARAGALTKALEDRLIASGPGIARKQIKRLFETPAPRVIANLPENVRLPIGVSERLKDELDASFDLVAVGNQTMKAKITKHAGITPEAFALIQEVLDEGEMIDEGREGKRTLYRKIGDTWFALVIAKSITGYLRVQTFYETSESVVRRRLEKHRADPDSNAR